MSTNPPANATNVPVNVAISLQTNVAIDPTTVNTGALLLYDRTTNLYVTGAASLSPSAMTVYFVPTTPLATGRLAAEDGASENNRRAKFYRLTPKGRKQLAVETTKWEKLARAMAGILRPAGGECRS